MNRLMTTGPKGEGNTDMSVSARKRSNTEAHEVVEELRPREQAKKASRYGSLVDVPSIPWPIGDPLRIIGLTSERSGKPCMTSTCGTDRESVEDSSTKSDRRGNNTCP